MSRARNKIIFYFKHYHQRVIDPHRNQKFLYYLRFQTFIRRILSSNNDDDVHAVYVPTQNKIK
jgi:hypothetical protein